MAKEVKTIRLDDQSVIVTSAEIEEGKEYSISVEVKEKQGGPAAAGDICIIRISE